MIKYKVVTKLYFIKQLFYKKKTITSTIDFIKNYNENRLLILEKEHFFESIAPLTLTTSLQNKESIKIPDLAVYLFNKGIINVDSSCIYYNNKLIADSFYENERFNEGFIKSHDKNTA